MAFLVQKGFCKGYFDVLRRVGRAVDLRLVIETTGPALPQVRLGFRRTYKSKKLSCVDADNAQASSGQCRRKVPPGTQVRAQSAARRSTSSTFPSATAAAAVFPPREPCSRRRKSSLLEGSTSPRARLISARALRSSFSASLGYQCWPLTQTDKISPRSQAALTDCLVTPQAAFTLPLSTRVPSWVQLTNRASPRTSARMRAVEAACTLGNGPEPPTSCVGVTVTLKPLSAMTRLMRSTSSLVA